MPAHTCNCSFLDCLGTQIVGGQQKLQDWLGWPNYHDATCPIEWLLHALLGGHLLEPSWAITLRELLQGNLCNFPKRNQSHEQQQQQEQRQEEEQQQRQQRQLLIRMRNKSVIFESPSDGSMISYPTTCGMKHANVGSLSHCASLKCLSHHSFQHFPRVRAQCPATPIFSPGTSIADLHTDKSSWPQGLACPEHGKSDMFLFLLYVHVSWRSENIVNLGGWKWGSEHRGHQLQQACSCLMKPPCHHFKQSPYEEFLVPFWQFSTLFGNYEPNQDIHCVRCASKLPLPSRLEKLKGWGRFWGPKVWNLQRSWLNCICWSWSEHKRHNQELHQMS